VVLIYFVLRCNRKKGFEAENSWVRQTRKTFQKIPQLDFSIEIYINRMLMMAIKSLCSLWIKRKTFQKIPQLAFSIEIYINRMLMMAIQIWSKPVFEVSE
jgi:predicted ester cyclase